MPRDLQRYDEPGHVHFWTISCYRRLAFFWADDMKRVVIEGLQRLRDDFRICLIGYVVMPEHVHVVLYPHPAGEDSPITTSRLLHAFKKHVGYHGKEALRGLWKRWGRLWSEPLNCWAHGEFDRQSIWHTRGYDFNIDRHETLLEKLEYCHKNPVTRELVDHPEQWAWSSYRFYEHDDRSVLDMDWDGQWPIDW